MTIRELLAVAHCTFRKYVALRIYLYNSDENKNVWEWNYSTIDNFIYASQFDDSVINREVDYFHLYVNDYKLELWIRVKE